MDVPEQERPRRRRPVQVIPSEPEAPQEPPRRIIIAQDEEPEWMVSAKKVSGAASRRNKQAEETRSFHHAERSSAEENPPPKEKPTQKKEEPSVRAKTVRKPTASKNTTARKKPRKLSKKARARGPSRPPRHTCRSDRLSVSEGRPARERAHFFRRGRHRAAHGVPS